MARILKMTGNGNNFLIVDLRDAEVRRDVFKKCRTKNRKRVAKQLCNPYQSVGADGLLFLENSRRADLKWDFYNADGSRAEMCGNAARCVGLYESSRSKKSAARAAHTFTLETRAGVVSLLIHNPHNIEVAMPLLRDMESPLFVRVAGQQLSFTYVNSGVPHAVVEVKNLHDVDKLEDIVENVRALPRFRRAGVNVTFYTPRTKSSIDSLTFERGVSGYTQACGTGAVAAAFTYLSHTVNKSKSPAWKIKVRVPGGPLHVHLDGEQPKLIGPAQIIADINLR